MKIQINLVLFLSQYTDNIIETGENNGIIMSQSNITDNMIEQTSNENTDKSHITSQSNITDNIIETGENNGRIISQSNITNNMIEQTSNENTNKSHITSQSNITDNIIETGENNGIIMSQSNITNNMIEQVSNKDNNNSPIMSQSNIGNNIVETGENNSIIMNQSNITDNMVEVISEIKTNKSKKSRHMQEIDDILNIKSTSAQINITENNNETNNEEPIIIQSTPKHIKKIKINKEDLLHSKGSNINEIDVVLEPDKEKYVLEFPEQLNKIRLNIKGDINETEEKNNKPIIKSNNEVAEDITENNSNNYDNLDIKYKKLIQDLSHVEPESNEFVKIDVIRKKNRMYQLNNDSCTYRADFTTDGNAFAGHFPPKTVQRVYKREDPNCNYKLMLLLMNDYNNKFFNKMNIYGIKLLLIRYYKEYIHDKKLLGHLCKKWKYEGKECSAIL